MNRLAKVVLVFILVVAIVLLFAGIKSCQAETDYDSTVNPSTFNEWIYVSSNTYKVQDKDDVTRTYLVEVRLRNKTGANRHISEVSLLVWFVGPIKAQEGYPLVKYDQGTGLGYILQYRYTEDMIYKGFYFNWKMQKYMQHWPPQKTETPPADGETKS